MQTFSCWCRKRCLGAFKVLAQQLAKRMGRAVPVQDFAWSVVEHRLHLLDLFSRELIEPRARGEKLAQQAIGVLVRSPLPGTMRVRKVDAHLRLLREEAVLAHFLALVVRKRAAGVGGQRAPFARGGPPPGGPGPRPQRDPQGKTSGP